MDLNVKKIYNQCKNSDICIFFDFNQKTCGSLNEYVSEDCLWIHVSDNTWLYSGEGEVFKHVDFTEFNVKEPSNEELKLSLQKYKVREMGWVK